ncbi:MAG: rRNA adenine dimethyltransferase family protein [Nitrospirota bacterium]
MTKKYLGQNFLYDPSIIRRIIEAAELDPEDLVVEIGPGPGRLTIMLSEKVRKVIAIELDERLYEKLKKELADYKNVELIHGDALTYSYEDLPNFKVVANIPYYITTPLMFRLLELKPKYPAVTQRTTEVIPSHLPLVEGRKGNYQSDRKNLKSMTLTVQKEVAERIIAKPGTKEFGVLSVMIQYFADASLKFVIPRKAFRPVPKVDSAVIHIKMRKQPLVPVKDENLFSRIIKTAFSQRRKMLSNSLKSMRTDVKDWLSKAGIDPHRRPETLSIKEFARLANTYD